MQRALRRTKQYRKYLTRWSDHTRQPEEEVAVSFRISPRSRPVPVSPGRERSVVFSEWFTHCKVKVIPNLTATLAQKPVVDWPINRAWKASRYRLASHGQSTNIH